MLIDSLVGAKIVNIYVAEWERGTFNNADFIYELSDDRYVRIPDFYLSVTPDNLTYLWRFLSWSFPGWAGFDVEAELVVGFGEAGGLGVELLAERLHGQGVTRGAELVQVDFDQVSLDVDVAAGA